MKESSRDVNDLHAELASRWLLLVEEFKKLYPSYPQPFLTQTYRSAADQNADYAKGRTAPGHIVTNAKAGQSLHNFLPALAFDFAFRDATGHVDWSAFKVDGKIVTVKELETIVGTLAQNKYGLNWGDEFRDYPHIEPRHYTWHDAALGKQPVFPAIT